MVNFDFGLFLAESSSDPRARISNRFMAEEGILHHLTWLPHPKKNLLMDKNAGVLGL